LGEFYRALNKSKALACYQQAEKKAHDLSLPYEETHARRGIALMKFHVKNIDGIHRVLEPIFRRYRRCGVGPSFLSYLTLP